MIFVTDVIGYIKNMEKTDVRSKTTPVLRRVILTLLLERYIFQFKFY